MEEEEQRRVAQEAERNPTAAAAAAAGETGRPASQASSAKKEDIVIPIVISIIQIFLGLILVISLISFHSAFFCDFCIYIQLPTTLPSVLVPVNVCFC